MTINKQDTTTEGFLLDQIKPVDIDLKNIRPNEKNFAIIHFRDIDKIRSRGRHLLMTFWLMAKWSKATKQPDGWFYIATEEKERCNVPATDFARNSKLLIEQDVIEAKYKAGPNGCNLYRFISEEN